MSGPTRVVGVVSTGVIGASWIGLFLARGLRVLFSDPAPDAAEKLKDHLHAIWPTLEESTLSPDASLANYTFVGSSLRGYYDQVDFVQENTPERQALKALRGDYADSGPGANATSVMRATGLLDHELGTPPQDLKSASDVISTTTGRVPLNTSARINERVRRDIEKRIVFYSTHPELIEQRLNELGQGGSAICFFALDGGPCIVESDADKFCLHRVRSG